MHNGLWVSALRGMDSTGMALVKKPHESPFVFKKALNAPDFLNLKFTDRIMNQVDECVVVLGHTRSSTRGGLSDENAHPFQFEHITLIHNGTVHNFRDLKAKTDSDVDSAHIAAAIAEHGAQEVMERINGEYCFIWHDAKAGTANIARNGGRTLFWSKVPGWQGLAFASEQEFLGMALGRNAAKIHKDGYFYPSEHKIHTFDLNKGLEMTTVPFVPWAERSRGPPPNTTSGSKNLRESPSMRGTHGTHLEPVTATGIKDFINEVHESTRRTERIHVKHAKFFLPPVIEENVEKARRELTAQRMQYGGIYGVTPIHFQQYKKVKDFGVGCVMFRGRYGTDHGEIHNISLDTWEAITGQPVVLTVAVGVRRFESNAIILLTLEEKFRKHALEEYDYDNRVKNARARVTTITMVTGPSGDKITEKAFETLAAAGCVHCAREITPKDADLIIWVNNKPLCDGCYNDKAVMESMGLKFAFDSNGMTAN